MSVKDPPKFTTMMNIYTEHTHSADVHKLVVDFTSLEGSNPERFGTVYSYEGYDLVRGLSLGVHLLAYASDNQDHVYGGEIRFHAHSEDIRNVECALRAMKKVAKAVGAACQAADDYSWEHKVAALAKASKAAHARIFDDVYTRKPPHGWRLIPLPTVRAEAARLREAFEGKFAKRPGVPV